MTDTKRKISKSDLNTLKWMWGTFKKERWHVYILIVANIINAVLTVLYADFSKKVINAATEEKSFERVMYFVFMFLLLVMFQLFLTLLSRSFSERCKARIEVTLRQHILSAVMNKNYIKISKFHTGEIQNRMTSDVTTISEGFTTILPNFIYLIVKLIGAFIYLTVIDKIFAFAFMIGGAFVFIFSMLFRKILKNLHKKVQESEGKVRSFIQEILSSLLVVKSFVAEDKVREEANDLMEENYKMKMKRRLFGIFSNAGINVTFNLAYVFALAFGAYRLIHGLAFGTVTAMIQLVNQIQIPFANLSTILPQYFAMLASCERIIEIDNIENEPESNKKDIDIQSVYNELSSINFDNISFGYDRDIILDKTSLVVNKGDFVAIMGISGIGKSTLLKLLLGVFQTQSGKIFLKTHDDNICVDKYTRKLFSYVPQGNFLLSGTIRDNLTFINPDVTDEEISQAIFISCADTFINELPKGLDTVIGERGIGLSEGQLQRLAIARSILSKSPIMLLDEATSALDEATELRFLQNLKQMHDKTCIIVSHKTAALEICNKHIQIIDGKIVLEAK